MAKLTKCAPGQHAYVTTTQGTTNGCVYCGHRAEWYNLGAMQLNGEVMERTDTEDKGK